MGKPGGEGRLFHGGRIGGRAEGEGRGRTGGCGARVQMGRRWGLSADVVTVAGGVVAAVGEELCVGAQFDYSSVVNDGYPVGILNRG